jgi:hypothetical protein
MKTQSKSRLFTTLLSFLLASFTYAQIPVYNSYPSATATIYLDFDGHFVNGTSWNYSGPFTCGPSNMTNAQITEIFNRVSEDYRPFNVNITTDSTKYWSAPASQRMRVVLTITSDWYGAAGGVSYINSFTWGDNTPCFVFTALLNYKTKNVAEAASHEIGHTLGLNHQSSYDTYCTKIAEYNAGVGSGEIGWAPIMGVGYYRNFTLWHNGNNPWGCSSFQDDLSIITSTYNGFGYRVDDYSANVNGSSTQAFFSNNRFSVDGVIEKMADKDVIKFTMPMQGRFHLDATPFSVGSGDDGSNLDIKLELMTNSQTVIGTYNPDLLLSATIDTMLQAGTYFLRVQSMGNIYAPEYASLGSYNLSAVITPVGVLPVHRLELHGAVDKNIHKFGWIIDADETVTDQILEVSYNGKDFQPVKSLSTAERAYSYIPVENGVLRYRLHVVFDNNKEYFSNTVALRVTSERPNIITNPVQNSIQISSPSSFSYTITDFSGRTVAKGTLTQGLNTISAYHLNKGMYIILYSNGQEQYAEKLMKE